MPRVVDEEHLRYFVTDPTSGEVFEFGEEEYFLCTCLTGQCSPAYICHTFERQFGWRLEPDHLQAFITRLRSLSLLANERLQPWEMRYPDEKGWTILEPDPFFRKAAPILPWCFSRWFVVGVTGLLLVAVFWLVQHSRDLLYEFQMAQNTLSALTIMLVPAFGLFVIFPLAEVGKALTCRYFGGYVSAFRLRLHHRIIPYFYAELWDSLWFLSKSKRVRTLSAGFVMYVLLLFLGIIGWNATEPWSLLHISCTYFILAVIFFGLIDALPLSKRDGYFLLCNQLEIDNLAERAEQYFLSVLLLNPKPEALSSNDARFFFIYGASSFLFSILLPVVFLGFIGYSLIEALHGAGATIFLVILLLRFETTIKEQWIKIPILGKILICQHGVIQMRFLIKTGLFITFAILLCLPYPFDAGGDFKILPAKQLGVRAEVAGFLKEILVKENQVVAKGQPVARLDDRLYLNRIEMLEASIAEAQAMLDLRLKGAKPEEIAKSKQAIEAARKNLLYSQKEEQRYAVMLREKAIPETDYQLVKRKRDIDQEALELAKRDFELVKSGARDEEIKALEEEINKYKAQLQQAKGDLEQTTLYSPLDGMVITPYLKQKLGQRLESGDLLLVVEDRIHSIAEIEVDEEDIPLVKINAVVKLRTWADPTKTIMGKVVEIAPVAYEKSVRQVERTLSNREQLLAQKQVVKPMGQVIRVLSEFSNDGDRYKTDMTGYAKIETRYFPVGLAFSRWLVRFAWVEVWSWLP